MKPASGILFFITIPIVLSAMLLAVVVPLFVQHFFTPSSPDENVVYPYLTSWEEAAA